MVGAFFSLSWRGWRADEKEAMEAGHRLEYKSLRDVRTGARAEPARARR